MKTYKFLSWTDQNPVVTKNILSLYFYLLKSFMFVLKAWIKHVLTTVNARELTLQIVVLIYNKKITVWSKAALNSSKLLI